MNVQRKLKIFTILFILLSLLGTFFITFEPLNPFIISFTNTPFTIINALLGNLIIILLIVTIVFTFSKKAYSRMRALLIISLIISFLGYLILIYIRYYQSPFLSRDLTFSKYAESDMTASIIVVVIIDLFLDFKIVLFSGFFILLILYIIFSKNKSKNIYQESTNPKVLFQNTKLLVATIIGLLLLSFGQIRGSYSYTNKRWGFNQERPLYGMQVTGLYNFYFYDLLGFNWADDNKTKSATVEQFEVYDRNQLSYTNLFGEKYGNILTLDQASTVKLSPKLGEVESLNGIFQDKNIIYIQLETLNTFLVDGSSKFLEDLNLLPNFKALINESYFFENFYSTVGLGNSSDAEISGMTGLYTPGNNLMYWQYGSSTYPREITFYDRLTQNVYTQMVDFKLNPLPIALGSDYYSASFHADNRQFYNRENTHPGMLGVNDFYHFTEKDLPDKIGNVNVIDAFPDYLETNPNSPWIGEKDLFEWVKIVAKQKASENQKYFLYPITIHPHTPYLYDPYIDDPILTSDDIRVNLVTLDYLNYLRFYNDVFKMITDLAKELENTIYVIYADHGTGFPLKDMRTILDNEDLTPLEAWEKLYQVPALIYAPDDESTNDVKSGLITGRQPLVRSQVDLFRTTLELVGRNEGNFYYGVNGLSDEKTFALQTRISLLVTDDFTIQLKKYAPTKSLNKNSVIFHNDVDYDVHLLIEKIVRFKQLNDGIINKNLIDQINRKKKGQS